MWWLIGLLVVALSFGWAAIAGAPYLPILPAERDQVLVALALKPGQSILDLGCGDGTLLLAAARAGIKAYGYEINPWLYLVARWRTRGYRKLVKIYRGNYWRATWPKVDVVYVFLIGHHMARLELLLNQQLTESTMVISYGFELPNMKATRHEGAWWLYNFPAAEA